ncbi:MAG: hypothetical protein JWQ96_2298 [Segetibacter sp.]|nr:hypothetical protein [Segetibacter sp.]
MKKNLLDAPVANELAQRANLLKQTLKPLWGSMTVTEMLHHCNAALTATLEGKPDNAIPTLKQRGLKFLFLKVIPRFPKNVGAPGKIDVKKSKLSPASFEIELEQFLHLIKTFSSRQQSIEVTHPVFGKLSTRQWGVFTWMHLDHHLRQFNV